MKLTTRNVRLLTFLLHTVCCFVVEWHEFFARRRKSHLYAASGGRITVCLLYKNYYLTTCFFSYRTILKQEAVVVMNLPAFTDYCEKAFINVYQTNALKVGDERGKCVTSVLHTKMRLIRRSKLINA